MPKVSNKKKVISNKGKAAWASKKAEEAPRITAEGPRRLELPKRVWHKPLSWRYQPPVPRYRQLPKARILFAKVARQLWDDRKLFGGIVLIFGFLNLVLVRGFAGSSDLGSLKQTLDSGLHGVSGHLASSGLSFLYLVSSSGSKNAADSGMYQSVLLVVCSLAFIWALRQSTAKHKVRVRDSFYQGMYPLVPVLLIMLLLSLQLVPLVVGASIFSVTNNGVAVTWWQHLLFIILFAGLAYWSLRMVTASFFALYIATLPDMTPLRAYRAARDLVYGRRLYLWRKIIFLPIVLLLLAAIIMFPLIMWLTPVAEWAFFGLSMIALPLVLGYYYNLYREML